MSSVAVVHKCRHFSLASYVCTAQRGESAESEQTDGHELIFVRKGAFVLTRGRDELLATPNEAILLTPGFEYRVRHPIGGGDECTIVSISSEIADSLEKHGESSQSFAVPPPIFREQSSLLAATKAGATSSLETEERIAGLVAATIAGSAATDASTSPTPTVRRRVAAARELIAAHFRESLPLATIGELVGLSPFHLSRAFRKVTGTSMHRYQTQLRLRAAMARLSEGEDDLAGLALDLGFSSHSHLTTSFARQFGLAPARFRAAYRRADRSSAGSQT